MRNEDDELISKIEILSNVMKHERSALYVSMTDSEYNKEKQRQDAMLGRNIGVGHMRPIICHANRMVAI